VRADRAVLARQRTLTVPATTNAIRELADQLVSERVELVVMEATSDYWKPFFWVFEAHGLPVQLVNPRDVKNVPGPAKTDRLDAQWLAKPAERGMLRASFIPPKPVHARTPEFTTVEFIFRLGLRGSPSRPCYARALS
jgi:transposase